MTKTNQDKEINITMPKMTMKTFYSLFSIIGVEAKTIYEATRKRNYMGSLDSELNMILVIHQLFRDPLIETEVIQYNIVEEYPKAIFDIYDFYQETLNDIDTIDFGKMEIKLAKFLLECIRQAHQDSKKYGWWMLYSDFAYPGPQNSANRVPINQYAECAREERENITKLHDEIAKQIRRKDKNYTFHFERYIPRRK